MRRGILAAAAALVVAWRASGVAALCGAAPLPARDGPIPTDPIPTADALAAAVQAQNLFGGAAATFANEALSRCPEEMDPFEALTALDRMERGDCGLPTPDTVTYSCVAGGLLLAGEATRAEEVLARGVAGASRAARSGRPRRAARSGKAARAAADVRVLFEDDHLLVVDKPSGMLMHEGEKFSARGARAATLCDAVGAGSGRELSSLGGRARRGVVHRLDFGVSGCVALAKTDAAHALLVRAFFRRELREKSYLALCAGTPAEREGRVEADVDGKSAASDYEVSASAGGDGSGASLVRVRTRTGRKHQVRKHMQALGCPIFLDPLERAFASSRRTKRRAAGARAPLSVPAAVREADNGDRIFLHAARLALTHPFTGKLLEVEAPPPAWWRPALEELFGEADIGV